jgi:hypothetical protein
LLEKVAARAALDVGVIELISSAVNAAIDTTTGDSQGMVKTMLQRRRQDFGARPGTIRC